MHRVMRAALVLALSGCASGATPAEESASSGDETADREEGVIAIYAAGEPAPAPEEPPPPVLPAARESAPAGPATGPFGRVEEIYARLERAPIGGGEAAATMRDAVQRLSAEIGAAAAEVRAIDAAIAEVTAEDAASRAHAMVRSADARDLLAARVLEANITIPIELRERIEGAPPEVVAEVERSVAERVAATLMQQAPRLFCYASTLYARAIEAGPGTPAAERAAAQRERYGAAFLESCAPVSE